MSRPSLSCIIKGAMSIGPSNIEEVVVKSKITKFSFATKQAVIQYFNRPAHYLFYFLLALGGIALLAGCDPSYKFWILTGLVGILNIATPTTRHDDVVVNKPLTKRHGKVK